MILGIGHDIVSISRISGILEKSKRFEERCFTDGERVYANGKNARAGAYAKRWAAKEAFAKAIGTGVSGGVFLKDIEVSNNNDGAPFIILHGGAKKALPDGSKIHLSLSDDENIASAFVVIERL